MKITHSSQISKHDSGKRNYKPGQRIKLGQRCKKEESLEIEKVGTNFV